MSSAAPRVTVVVTAFREGRFLDECLRSIRNQTYADLEVVVVDDGGDDESIGVGMRHAADDGRLRVLRTPRNRGLGSARNTALLAGRGAFVTFVDGDDVLPPRSIEVRAARLEELAGDDGVAGVYGDFRHLDELSKWPQPGEPRLLEPITLASTGGTSPFIVSAPLVVREALVAAGGFAEGVTSCEDYLAWMRLLAAGKAFEPVPEFVAMYRQKRGSMLRSNAGSVLAITAAVHDWYGDVAPSDPERHTEQDNGRAVPPIIAAPAAFSSEPTSVAAAPMPADDFRVAAALTAHVDDYERARAFLAAGAAPLADHDVLWPPPAPAGDAAANGPRVHVVAAAPVDVLEAVALAEAAEANGYVIRLSAVGTAREALGLAAARSMPLVPADAGDWADAYLAFRDWGAAAGLVDLLKGDRRVVLRTSGASAFDWTSPESAKRLRGAPLLVQSRLEEVILGDRRPHPAASPPPPIAPAGSAGDGVDVLIDLEAAERGPATLWLEQAHEGVAAAGAEPRLVTLWSTVAAALRDYDVRLVPLRDLGGATLTVARVADEGCWLAAAGWPVVFADSRTRREWLLPYGVDVADPTAAPLAIAQAVASGAEGRGGATRLRSDAGRPLIEAVVDALAP